MRNIKELLQVLLDNQQYFNLGLCLWVDELVYKDIISYRERYILHDYINKHRPSMFSSIEAWKNSNSNYYWNRNNIVPRLNWINKHIEKLK